MFTGIISDVAPVKKSLRTPKGLTLVIKRPSDWQDLTLGESIATNGVCLTVSALRTHEYECHLMPETLQKTAFGSQVPPAVNLERSLTMKDRFGGHFVQGHVDGVGTVVSVTKGADYRLAVSFATENNALVIYKGSIGINGVSLTVAEVKDNVLTVALIPHTLEHTTLASLNVNDKVNLEFDMIGKYIDKALKTQKGSIKS
jgi:riboflavin synthase